MMKNLLNMMKKMMKENWTKEAINYGNSLIKCLIDIDSKISLKSQKHLFQNRLIKMNSLQKK
jgi:hypothetical protein